MLCATHRRSSDNSFYVNLQHELLTPGERRPGPQTDLRPAPRTAGARTGRWGFSRRGEGRDHRSWWRHQHRWRVVVDLARAIVRAEVLGPATQGGRGSCERRARPQSMTPGASSLGRRTEGTIEHPGRRLGASGVPSRACAPAQRRPACPLHWPPERRTVSCRWCTTSRPGSVKIS